MAKKEGDEIINWIESQPELDYIRVKANKTLCDYRKDQTELSERIIVNSREDLSLGKESTLKKILNVVWVPGSKLRGTQIASKELDNSLSTSSKVMSISTIWDFVCTLPIFTYILSPIAKGAAGPAGLIFGFIILWASNITGENSTNRTLNNTSKAKASLIAFLILSLAKTAVSGVGIDMIISKNRIVEEFATEKILEKSDEEKEAINQALYDEVDDPAVSNELRFAKQACNKLLQQIESLDLTKGRQRKLQREISDRAYGSNGPCTNASNLGAVESKERGNKQLKIDQKKELAKLRIEDKNKMSKTEYLWKYYNSTYDKYFTGKPPGIDYIYTGKDIPENRDYREIEWTDGSKSEAVGAAMKQFVEKVQKGDVASLGFSIFAFVVSVILSLTASILLYTTGKNSEVKASFTSGLGKKSNALLSGYRDDLDEGK